MKKLPALGVALGVSLALLNSAKADAAIVSYESEFSRFLPSTFKPGDTFDLSFRIDNSRRPRPIRIHKIIYIVVTPRGKIIITLFFEKLSSKSSSKFTTPPGAIPADGIDLTLAGSNAFAITNGFVPFNFKITRSDILAAYLSLSLDTDGLVAGDGFVASLNLNGKSIGSQVFKPDLNVIENIGIASQAFERLDTSERLDTAGLVAGDGFVDSLNLNGKSIGSQAFEPDLNVIENIGIASQAFEPNLNARSIGIASQAIPEPSTVLAILTLGGAMATFKKKSRPLGMKDSQDNAA
ncbi:MAG: PEP-CTERM sorting domain-containing protein [Microcystis sp. M57BS1]|uniref:PEP-CTERM sorting domain-containing protein n=1 Tax=unclassified Microcystis TaxID=2643300 RepID=UPI00257B1203|nr:MULTISPECIES: PEP-CTERM sorting domain-containing protein [unclassified Microcystis]MCA2596016.1 PEP-CTERM sorting domain-containing protein [Microcystis sp. M38BS1]MCA2611695.1 PEP-CTERM sorting domain-containing protein [Microcystis sp. M27BS1]MCA2507339.1 PEP-CTERM sorting domain-containing protein [Microcystis sp. M62BS1]MCA2509657.1 PEP-CTERM sorting domain-containing protein [Microcystis sp. M60BS1]MCA2522128.1 PEP-CTERM sorting domain-containing protein [Microcystis sp. M63BS1]